MVNSRSSIPFRLTNRAMKFGSSNGLKSNQIKLFMVILFTVFLVWAWESAPHSSTFILRPDPLSQFLPAPSTYVHEHPSAEEDFPNGEMSTQNINKEEDVLSLPPLNSSAEQSSIKPVKRDEVPIAVAVAKNGCNYAKGSWVYDEKRPLYSGFGCKEWLSEGWACRLTQRSDFSYEKFKWRPDGCDMPDFDGPAFLSRMKDKTIAYVGDSLGRQMFQSMMCMLTVSQNRTQIEDIGRTHYGFTQPHGAKRPNGWAYRFLPTNTTLLFYWSSTLCDLEPLDVSNPRTRYAMHLDQPPSFLKEKLHKFDVLVINTGHHWNRGKIKGNRWDMYVNGSPDNDKKRVLIWKAKNFTINSVVKWLDEEMPNYPKLKVFYRSISPRHFYNGDWNSGGSCDNTNPLAKGSVVTTDGSEDPDAELAVRGTRVRLLDITGLSRLRDEGHISKYSVTVQEGVQDCLHWCLPGVPDTWNEILAAQL